MQLPFSVDPFGNPVFRVNTKRYMYVSGFQVAGLERLIARDRVKLHVVTSIHGSTETL